MEELTRRQVLSFSVDTMSAGPKSRRTAMGEYIVPVGGKPLTSLGDCSPAPSDYTPKCDLTKRAAPQYSVAGPYKAQKQPYHASPADNDTGKPLEWRDCSITLKGKGKTTPYDVRADAHLNDSVGPLQYRVEHRTLGKGGPKPSIAALNRVHGGPPNRLVQPVDTHGVENPAPTYRPNSAYWGHGPEKSFGGARRTKTPEGPGPAEYDVKEIGKREGPAFSLAKRLPPPLKWQESTSTDSPGPGAYQLDTTIGKAVAKSLTGRHYPEMKDCGPAPNLYSLPDKILDAPSAPMPYRWVEPQERPHPGPDVYSITKCDLPNAPDFSMRKHTRPCFPDILHYPLISNEQPRVPGPGSYEEQRNLSENDKPKFSMRKITKKPQSSVPGPNHYHIQVTSKPDAKTAPAFSMGKRLSAVDSRQTPGPAAYYPSPSYAGTGYSMTKRPKATKKFVTPAPNAYPNHCGQTRTGVFRGAAATLKSRGSPYVYSGIQANTAMDLWEDRMNGRSNDRNSYNTDKKSAIKTVIVSHVPIFFTS